VKLDKDAALGKKTKRGLVWGLLREGFGELIAFPISMVQARLLSPEEFGIAAAAGFFTLLAERLSELGFNAALVRTKDIQPIHLSTVFVVNLVTGILSFVALTAVAPAIASFYEIPETATILPVAALAFLISPFGTVPAALISRNLQYQASAAVDVLSTLSFFGTSVVFAWFGFSYMSLVYGRLASVVVLTVLRIYYARWRPSLRFSAASLREILPYGLGTQAKRLLDYTAKQGDNLVVGKVMGVEALGIYDKAYSTMNRFLTRMTIGPGLVFRIFAIIHEEPGRFRRAYQKVMMSAALVVFPAFATLIAVAPQLIVVLFGRRWLPSALPFQLLCVAGGLKLLNQFASSATQAVGWIWAEVWRQLVLIALTALGIIAFRVWGPAGAAAGVLLATFVMSVLMNVLLVRVTHLSWRDLASPLAPGLLCAVGAGVVTLAVEWLVRAATPQPNPLLLLVCQAPAVAAFVALFLLFAPLPRLRALVREYGNDLAPDVVKRQPWVQAYLTEPSSAVE
jgi:PST family polysaccharide transporter